MNKDGEGKFVLASAFLILLLGLLCAAIGFAIFSGVLYLVALLLGFEFTFELSFALYCLLIFLKAMLK